MTAWHKHSMRLLRHELRRGELTIILLAIVLAVSAVFALSGFSNKIKQALIAESSAFIAADRVIDTGRELAPVILEKAASYKLQQAQQVHMMSMVFAADNMLLSSLTAVSESYPLRGELLVSATMNATDAVVAHAPKLGEVWLEENGFKQLDVSIGDSIEVGVSRFIVSGMITQIPDASFGVFNAGPILFLNQPDMQRTELIQPGSRLSYKYLFAGEEANITEFEHWITPLLTADQRWYDVKSQQSPLARALNRADKYLALASMLGIVLAAVAVAVASRRYSQRHQSTVAVFKAMGASRAYVTKVYCLHWTLLSLLSIAIGLIVGYLILNIGLTAMRDYLAIPESGAMLYPLLVAIMTGLICAIAFALHPLFTLVNTSPMMLLRGRTAESKAGLLAQLPAIIAVFALLYLFSQDLTLSTALLVGGLLVSMILYVIGRLLMSIGRSAGSKAGQSWHLAWANLTRRASENSIQLISFTIAIQLLLIIVVMKNSLIDEWQQQLPDDTANRFLVNISSEQVDEVNNFIDSSKIHSSGLFPVVRGRLTAINSDKVTEAVSKEKSDGNNNGRDGVGRELNLTWRNNLPFENQVLAGQWWQTGDERALVSIESTLADRLDIDVNDKLQFQLGSEVVNVTVASIRKVNWQTLQPNFYMIFNQHVLEDFPATYISSLYVPPELTSDLQQFLTQYPTITLIDVDAIIKQLRSVVNQVSVAIEFILLLVVLAGSLVLAAQVQASMEERERELAILRTLGASGKLLRNSVLFEFVALGGLAGLMASIAMELGVYILQSRIFEMPAGLHLEYWFIGIVAGASFVGAVGLLSCWRLLNMSSVTLIRRTM